MRTNWLHDKLTVSGAECLREEIPDKSEMNNGVVQQDIPPVPAVEGAHCATAAQTATAAA